MRYCTKCGLEEREPSTDACWRCGCDVFASSLRLVDWTLVITESDRRLLRSLRISPE